MSLCMSAEGRQSCMEMCMQMWRIYDYDYDYGHDNMLAMSVLGAIWSYVLYDNDLDIFLVFMM